MPCIQTNNFTKGHTVLNVKMALCPCSEWQEIGEEWSYNKAFFQGTRTAHGNSNCWDAWLGQLSWFGLWRRRLSFIGLQGSKLQLILTLEALLTLLFPFDALWEFIGDKDVFKKVQMIVLKVEKERPFEQNLDMIKCWVCSGMFRFYSCRPLLFIKFL